MINDDETMIRIAKYQPFLDPVLTAIASVDRWAPRWLRTTLMTDVPARGAAASHLSNELERRARRAPRARRVRVARARYMSEDRYHV